MFIICILSVFMMNVIWYSNVSYLMGEGGGTVDLLHAVLTGLPNSWLMARVGNELKWFA